MEQAHRELHANIFPETLTPHNTVVSDSERPFTVNAFLKVALIVKQRLLIQVQAIRSIIF